MRIELDQLFLILPEQLIIQFMKKDNVSRDSFMNRWEVIQPADEGSWKSANAGSVPVRVRRVSVSVYFVLIPLDHPRCRPSILRNPVQDPSAGLIQMQGLVEGQGATQGSAPRYIGILWVRI